MYVYLFSLPLSPLVSNQEPTIWVQALTYCASREECKSYISQVLTFIEQHHLLQPLVVVQMLAQNR